MIKLIIVIYALVFTANLYANDLPIKDNALKACVIKAMEKVGTTNPQLVKKLKCHNKGVKSVSGLDTLTGLESLSLFGNRIEQADLSLLKHLTHINLAKNRLTEIQIHSLVQLESLYLFKNKLTTINFSGLSSLRKMRLMENQLELLDISPLTSLVEGHLWDNQLKDLQITGLTNLEFLDVKQNPMPDELYDFYDKQTGITITHDGNADDWK